MKTALVAIAKDEDNYLKEWVDYNVNLGFDDIYIFQNNWRYTRGDITNQNVHFIPYDGHLMMNPCYNNFILQNYDKYDFITCLDCDEFLYIKGKKTVNEWLSEYVQYKAIYIPWRLFGDNGLQFVENDEYSCLKRFTKCDDRLYRLGKNIINTGLNKNSVIHYNPHILMFTNSMPPKIPELIFPDKQVISSPWNFSEQDMLRYSNQPAELWHFRNKTYQECYDRKFGKDQAFNDATKDPVAINIDEFNKVFDEQNKNIIDVTEIL